MIRPLVNVAPERLSIDATKAVFTDGGDNCLRCHGVICHGTDKSIGLLCVAIDDQAAIIAVGAIRPVSG